MLVSTKLAPSPFGSGYDPDGIRAGAEGSLRALGSFERSYLTRRGWRLRGLLEKGVSNGKC